MIIIISSNSNSRLSNIRSMDLTNFCRVSDHRVSTNKLSQNLKSEKDDILELPKRRSSDDHYLDRTRGSVVRDYVDLLGDLDADADAKEEEKEKENGKENAPSTPADTTQPVPSVPGKETPAMSEPVKGGTAVAKELKLTLVLQDNAGVFSGDLGQYADTAWNVVSPTTGGVIPKQSLGLGDATVRKRYRTMFSSGRQTVTVAQITDIGKRSECALHVVVLQL